MTVKHKTTTSYVNLDKAFAKIRNYPGARLDRKVFKTIAEQANDKGIAEISEPSITVRESVVRLAQKGLMTGGIAQFTDPPYYVGPVYTHLTCRIDSSYMLNTDNRATAIFNNTKRIEKLEKRLDDLAAAIKKPRTITIE